jgi:hypothetical protein
MPPVRRSRHRIPRAWLPRTNASSNCVRAAIAYVILLLACAIAGFIAATDLKDENAQPPGFPVFPPPRLGALPDFDVIDDLPRNED